MQEQTTQPSQVNATAQPAPAARQATSTIVFGCVSGAMAIWLLPYVFGPVAMIFGAVALLQGDRRGRWVIAVGVLGLVLGLIVNLIPDHILFSGA